MSLKQNIRTLFCSTVSSLLSVIIVFNLGFNVFHIRSEEHHHSEQTCSADEEFNACHRYLIHHEKSTGCDGEHEHFTKKTDYCFVCKYYKQRNEFSHFESYSAFYLPDHQINYRSVSFKNKIQNYSSYYLRGPPITA